MFFANWINGSSIVKVVESIVVVVPLTVKLPLTVRSSNVGESDVPTACPILTVSVAPSPEPLTETPVPALTAAI